MVADRRGHPKKRGTKARRDSSRAGGTFGRKGRARQRARNDGPGDGHSSARQEWLCRGPQGGAGSPRTLKAKKAEADPSPAPQRALNRRPLGTPPRCAPRYDTKQTTKSPRARNGKTRRGTLGYKRLRRGHGQEEETDAGLKPGATLKAICTRCEETPGLPAFVGSGAAVCSMDTARHGLCCKTQDRRKTSFGIRGERRSQQDELRATRTFRQDE